MFNQCETSFNLERHLVVFLMNSTFFTELSRHLTKVPTRDIPTAGVTYDQRTDQIMMLYNPDFFESLSNWEINGVLTHEFYHLVFGHLTARRKTPGKLWNIATDLAINSIIVKNSTGSSLTRSGENDDRPLPAGALIPGQWPVMPDGRKLSDEEKKAGQLATLIAGFPKMKPSEWYFDKLMEVAKKNRQPGDPGDPDSWIDSFDNHDVWDGVPEDQREYIEGKIKSIVEKAVQKADATSMWGNIPAELREEIRRSVSTIINWRAVLRQFIGTLVRGGRTSSIKRINRRYPYIHPGLKRSYTAKLLIARDESGSVSNEMLEMFFGELNALTRKVEIDFLPFDCYCHERDIVRWARGSVPAKATKRTKMGGTDFDAPTRVFNDPKNRGRWDGLLILTDGMAPSPIPARGKRGWVLAQGCSLHFTSPELQVFLSKDKPMSGAWR